MGARQITVVHPDGTDSGWSWRRGRYDDDPRALVAMTGLSSKSAADSPRGCLWQMIRSSNVISRLRPPHQVASTSMQFLDRTGAWNCTSL